MYKDAEDLLEKKDYDNAYNLLSTINRKDQDYVKAQLKMIEIEDKFDSIAYLEAITHFNSGEYEFAKNTFSQFDKNSIYYEDAQKYLEKSKIEVNKKISSSLTRAERQQLESGKAKVISLYKDLLKFKDKPDFAEYGFAVTYKYKYWLEEIDKIQHNSELTNLLYDCGYPVIDLREMGFAYLKSAGKETEFTSDMKEKYKHAFKNL